MKRFVHVITAVCCFYTLSNSQPEMVMVKGGTFFMGDTIGDADERPVHPVLLNDFYIASTETTVAQFRAFIEATGFRTDAELGEGSYIWDSLGWHKSDGVYWRHNETGRLRPADQGNYPVLHVSWNDAAHYCNWLSDQSGLRKVYDFQGDSVRIDWSANGYRLPAEAEWEYAAAGGKSVKTDKYAGSGLLSALAWYSGNASRHPHAVGLKAPNALGIFDCSGNVWEWCHDWYARDYYSKSYDARHPSGPVSGTTRVLRGGSWNNNGKHLRVASRSSRYPDFRDGSVGFRVARRK